MSLFAIQISQHHHLHFRFIKDFSTKICSTKSKIVLVQIKIVLVQIAFSIKELSDFSMWDHLIMNIYQLLEMYFRVGLHYLVILKLHFRIVSMVESGLILKWYKDHMSKENKCDKSLSSIDHNQAKLKATGGAFIILSVGLSVASVVFVLEIFTVKLKTKLPSCNIRHALMKK